MSKMKGCCHNYDGCDMATEKVVQEKEKTEFICEECGKPLYPVDEKRKTTYDHKKIVIILIAMLIIVGCIVYFWGGKSQSDVPTIDSMIVDSITVADSIENSPETTIKVDTVVIRDTVVSNNTTTISEKMSTKTVVNTTTRTNLKKNKSSNSNTLRLSYGTYTGAIKGGYPHGQGRLTYTTSRQINQFDSKGRIANPDEYIIGEFYNGFVVFGKLYDTNGNVITSLNFGQGPEDVYESK